MCLETFRANDLPPTSEIADQLQCAITYHVDSVRSRDAGTSGDGL